MNKLPEKLNSLYVTLEAAYNKKAKLLKIVNMMKHSNISYKKSIDMKYPIYSLKYANDELKYAQQHYDNYINKQRLQQVKVPYITELGKPKYEKYRSLLSRITRARNHLNYVNKLYDKYKLELIDTNNRITTIKTLIKANISEQTEINIMNFVSK
jgi:hypothetical protein